MSKTWINPCHSLLSSKVRFLTGQFFAGADRMFAGFIFTVAFADLGGNFFGDQVDGGVEIAFGIFREQVWSTNAETDGAFELAGGRLCAIVVERYAGVDGKTFDVLELVNPGEDMFLDGIGQRDVMRR